MLRKVSMSAALNLRLGEAKKLNIHHRRQAKRLLRERNRGRDGMFCRWLRRAEDSGSIEACRSPIPQATLCSPAVMMEIGLCSPVRNSTSSHRGRTSSGHPLQITVYSTQYIEFFSCNRRPGTPVTGCLAAITEHLARITEHFTRITEHFAPFTEHLARTTEHFTRITEHFAPITEQKAPITEHLARTTEHFAPITEHLAPITEHFAPITEHLAPITEHLAPITEHLAPITEQKAPIIEQKAPIIEHLAECGVVGKQ